MSYDKELVAHKLQRWENYLNNYKLPAWKELPDIGLYMDQVIALLGQYLDFHGQDVLMLYSALILNGSSAMK